MTREFQVEEIRWYVCGCFIRTLGDQSSSKTCPTHGKYFTARRWVIVKEEIQEVVPA